MRKDYKKLFDKNRDSSSVIKEENVIKQHSEEAVAADSITSWDQLFAGVFPEPLQKPFKTVVAVRRSIPAIHPDNQLGIDLQLPILFTTDDLNHERWFFYLYDLGKDQTKWSFLLFKPDRGVLLNYLAGKAELATVYRSAKEFFIAIPDELGQELIPVTVDTMPEVVIPAKNSFYTKNLWFDPEDVYYGFNVADVEYVQELAKKGRFY